MEQLHRRLLPIVIVSAFSLSACNSNDHDASTTSSLASSTSSGGSSGTTTAVTVTPSLGKIINAKVVLKSISGTVLGTGDTGNSGKATINVSSSATGPIVVEVSGATGSKYFDESKKNELDFDNTRLLHAMLPVLASSAEIGVSALTEVAFQSAVKQAGDVSKLTAARITAANEAIRKALAPELSTITAAPQLVGNTSDLSGLANTEGGKYALKLAALTQLASTESTPALAILNQMVDDISSDFKLDGKGNAGRAIASYDVTNLSSQLRTQLNTLITNAKIANLTADVFMPVVGDITVTLDSSTGASGNYNLLVETTGAGIALPTVTIKNIAKPNTQSEFCSNDSVQQQFPSGLGSISVTSCSFSNNVGNISLQISASGINLGYTVKYTYTAA